MQPPAGPAVHDIRSRVLRGLVWVVASQAGLQIARALAAIAIARMLTPDEYGLAALALVFSSLVLIFSDMALGAALLQRRTLSEHDRSTAFWVMIEYGRVVCTGDPDETVTVGAGFVLGIMDVIAQMPRSYEARAETEIVAFRIDLAAFLGIIEAHFDLARDFIAMLAGSTLAGD